MKAATAAVILGLLACASVASASMALCNKDGVPLRPTNSLLMQNAYDAGSNKAVTKISWRSQLPSNPAGGCMNSWRVEWYDPSGAKQGQHIIPASVSAKKVDATVPLPPGKRLTLKVFAVNSQTGKVSLPETIGTITSAAGGAHKPTSL